MAAIVALGAGAGGGPADGEQPPEPPPERTHDVLVDLDDLVASLVDLPATFPSSSASGDRGCVDVPARSPIFRPFPDVFVSVEIVTARLCAQRTPGEDEDGYYIAWSGYTPASADVVHTSAEVMVISLVGADWGLATANVYAGAEFHLLPASPSPPGDTYRWYGRDLALLPDAYRVHPLVARPGPTTTTTLAPPPGPIPDAPDAAVPVAASADYAG